MRYGLWIRMMAFAVLLSANSVGASEVRLSAAATLSEALKEISTLYVGMTPEVAIRPNFAASGALARQIEQGAPADVFVSANRRWMEHLVARNLIDATQVQILAGSSIVLVGRQGPLISSLEDLAQLERIALVNPKSGPAGEYAEQALKNAGMLERLASKLIVAQDVRQAVVYADRGEVDGALVYVADARLARQAIILHEVAPHLHDEILYPMALTVSGRRNPDAVAFFAFLQSEQARRLLEAHGFVVK